MLAKLASVLGFRHLFEWIAGWRRPSPIAAPVRNEATVKTVAPPAKRLRRSSVGEIDGGPKETLAELLENLETTFKWVRTPAMKGSWIRHDDIIGLRKLGVHVPHPWLLEWNDDEATLAVDTTKPMSALMSVSLCASDRLVNLARKVPGKENQVWPDAMFAIKARKLPPYVAARPGVPYQFGFGYRFISDKMFWGAAWIVIDPKTGALHVCDELVNVQNVVPLRSPVARRNAHGSSARFSTRAWRHARMLDADYENPSVDNNRIIVKNYFRALHSWWAGRDERWSVAVYRGGERVTFGIEPANTKTYFASRDKSIKTPSGKTRKIIHFVEEHERTVNGRTVTVKAHVRGLREFDWMGFRCVVTAPRLTGRTAAFFELAPEELDDDVELPKGYMSMGKLGLVLARAEDDDIRARRKSA